ncbi:hypothetical protein [Aquimarina sp. I32.4]|uniref:hypothetical protein n=1 Tax=Aquimarina sp. I32.4 TaxID=2053903 RepID=UPI000CDEEC8B|nr:hypothetical protein [Aquimarina sp. I32.4]
MIYQVYKVLFFVLVLGLFGNCTSKTITKVDKTKKILENGKHLVVEKINKNTSYKGVLTKHIYNSTHQYTYSFTVDRGDVNWDEGAGEPKHILFCNKEVYVHYLKEKYTSITHKDTLGNQVLDSSYFKVEEAFELYVDKRYFFNFFGDEYWVEVTPETYEQKKETCNEYDIPNDNELTVDK